jgi:hypothetical protein
MRELKFKNCYIKSNLKLKKRRLCIFRPKALGSSIVGFFIGYTEFFWMSVLDYQEILGDLDRFKTRVSAKKFSVKNRHKC